MATCSGWKPIPCRACPGTATWPRWPRRRDQLRRADHDYPGERAPARIPAMTAALPLTAADVYQARRRFAVSQQPPRPCPARPWTRSSAAAWSARPRRCSEPVRSSSAAPITPSPRSARPAASLASPARRPATTPRPWLLPGAAGGTGHRRRPPRRARREGERRSLPRRPHRPLRPPQGRPRRDNQRPGCGIRIHGGTFCG